MSDFHDLVQNMNDDSHDYRERPLEILAAMNKPAPKISWTERDVAIVQHVFKNVDDLKNNLISAVGRFVKAQVDPLKQRIAQLEAKTENWEYRGVYEHGETYRESNFVTHSGSLWICRECETTSVPGGDQTWQLVVKRGRDAR